ncbi:AAA family ATPase [Janthinobacterium sp. HH104]|uniref:KGGVGR-motif variant AAA ATPase n=1 Tax=Janthinobacterium sp. HH104 TaxID=1537276 RepID=UPI0015869360
MNNVRFDESLPILVNAVIELFDEQTMVDGLVLRDTTGKLAFFFNSARPETDVKKLSVRLRADLCAYARTDRVAADIDDYGVAALFKEAPLHVSVATISVKVIDRRLVGADWLRPPEMPAAPPSRFVFASLKGGVGRTTTLAVVAADLAAQGKRVLAIDLDMEAPGLGAILLDSGTTPDFGMIDAMVESGVSKLDDEFMADMVGPSSLADRHGRIDVIPAFGRRSLDNPGDVLSKIARAYAEKINEDGTTSTILDEVKGIVDYFSDLTRYDVILIDARAGLHETTASAILGLGAHVLLFGLDEPQTFQGYTALLSHLSRISIKDGGDSQWINSISMVQGKASDDASERLSFVENCQDLFIKSDLIAPRKTSSNEVPIPAGPFNDVPWEDEDAVEEIEVDDEVKAVDVTYVLHDEQFRLFNPNARRDLLSLPVYTKAYEAVLKKIETVMLNDVGGVV